MQKYWEGPSQSICGTTVCTVKGRVGVGMEGEWIGFRVRLCPDSLEWDMKNVEHEKLNFLKRI